MNTLMNHNMENLQFRRQFILIDKQIDIPKNWVCLPLLNKRHAWRLYCHPDLSVLQVNHGHRNLLLLGYMLNPENPEQNDRQILEELLMNQSFEDLIRSIDKYTGRFILVYYDEQGMKIFNDATGFRELYYTFNDSCMACGSTSTFLAETLQIPLTKDVNILKYYHSNDYKESDHNWVGYVTMYENVLHLPPNHYLDIELRMVKRFWPVKPLHRIPLADCVRACADILRGTVESAVKRYSLHMGITAGWDTRLLLSATREHRDRIYYYLNKTSSMNSDTADVAISSRLSEKLGFELNTIAIPDEVDPQFKKIFHSNNILAHEKLLPVFYEVYRRKWDQTYTFSGTMGNAMARIYMRLPRGIRINGANIARLIHLKDQPYIVSSLDHWVEEVKTLCSEFHIDIMDLYQWEQENAHWASLTASEQDIAREEIRPFNNRKLIALFFSLDARYRYQLYPRIYIEIMKQLWPEVMSVPVNPASNKIHYRILRVLGLERMAYRCYKNWLYRLS
jgi:hypothetical protein